MVKLIVLLFVGVIGLTACLPDVSTETSELEARAILEDKVISVCKASQSAEALNRILQVLDTASIQPTRDFWVFSVTPSPAAGEMEVLVFPSKIVTGSYVRYLQTRICN